VAASSLARARISVGRSARRQVMALEAEGVDLRPRELGSDRRLVLQDKPESSIRCGPRRYAKLKLSFLQSKRPSAETT
jgi:hypothetical protein